MVEWRKQYHCSSHEFLNSRIIRFLVNTILFSNWYNVLILFSENCKIMLNIISFVLKLFKIVFATSRLQWKETALNHIQFFQPTLVRDKRRHRSKALAVSLLSIEV